MEGIRLYIWIVFYILQLWLVSVAVFLPAVIAWLSRGRRPEHLAIANELLPRLLRLQAIALILFGTAISSTYSRLPTGQWGFGLLAIENANPAFFYLGVAGLFAGLLGAIWLKRSQAKNAISTNAGWIATAGNFLYLLLLVATSSTLFPPADSKGIELNSLDFLFRLSHVLFSAIVLTGAELAFATRALGRRMDSSSEVAARLGQWWMVIGSSVQIFTGFALLLLAGMKGYPVPAGHILLTFGILLAIGVVIMSAMSLSKSGSIERIARATAMTALMTLFLMGALRVIHLKTKYKMAMAPISIESIKE
ncbi:MAG: hypothetical protein OEM52_09975 [bacterium]|nr:hypothetical protein [bacterium]